MATPLASSAAAIAGPRRAGSRRAIAISAGSAPACDQLRDLDRDRLRLAPRAGRAQQGQAVVGRHAARASGAPKPRARWKSRALAVFAGVRLGDGLLADADPLAQLAEQAGAGGERRVARPRRGARRHLGLRRQRLDQLELVGGEVVEAVEEERPVAPEAAVAAQQRDRLAGDPVGVDPAAAARAPRRSRRRAWRCRRGRRSPPASRRSPRPPPGRPRPPAARRAGRSKARAKPGRRAERRSGPSRSRARSIATVTARSRWAGESSAPGGDPAAVATARKRAPKVVTVPPSAAPARAELALEGEDVVDGWARPAAGRAPGGGEAAPDQPAAARVRAVRGSASAALAQPMDGGPARCPPQTAAPGPVLPSTAPSKLPSSSCPSAS